jgi:transposase
MARSKRYHSIPTELTEAEFNEFILGHLTEGVSGPKTKLPFHTIFNYILKLMHTGCQWAELPIKKDANGKPEIHYTRVFRTYKRWMADGCYEAIFEGSVAKLFKNNMLDTSVVHGDGSTTTAKKGAII